MLRSLVLGIGVLALVCGLLAIFKGGYSVSITLGIWGLLIVAGVLFERVRYKPLERSTPGGRWVRTPERFIDDETGAPVTVWLDPQTGERKYIRD
ncbi:MAG TPA: hypothetical protein VGG48_02750 [Rhizomicrobium sp.]|jgi:uncharacterized membrane protein HdeD (DUF308 family)